MNNTKYPEIVNQMTLRNERLRVLAELLNVDISQISRRLTGKKQWTFDEIIILMKHYNLDFETLFKRKED